MDQKDWECSQYLSSWYYSHGKHLELAVYFNQLALNSIPIEPPRLAMFKASMLMQLPYPISDLQFIAYPAIHSSYSSLQNISIPTNRTYSNNHLQGCGVVDGVILRLAEKLQTRYPEFNESFIVPQNLQASTSKADYIFSTIFAFEEFYSKVERTLIPMIVSNKGK